MGADARFGKVSTRAKFSASGFIGRHREWCPHGAPCRPSSPAGRAASRPRANRPPQESFPRGAVRAHRGQSGRASRDHLRFQRSHPGPPCAAPLPHLPYRDFARLQCPITSPQRSGESSPASTQQIPALTPSVASGVDVDNPRSHCAPARLGPRVSQRGHAPDKHRKRASSEGRHRATPLLLSDSGRPRMGSQLLRHGSFGRRAGARSTTCRTRAIKSRARGRLLLRPLEPEAAGASPGRFVALPRRPTRSFRRGRRRRARSRRCSSRRSGP
jgi:hypothetical protein